MNEPNDHDQIDDILRRRDPSESQFASKQTVSQTPKQIISLSKLIDYMPQSQVPRAKSDPYSKYRDEFSKFPSQTYTATDLFDTRKELTSPATIHLDNLARVNAHSLTSTGSNNCSTGRQFVSGSLAKVRELACATASLPTNHHSSQSFALQRAISQTEQPLAAGQRQTTTQIQTKSQLKSLTTSCQAPVISATDKSATTSSATVAVESATQIGRNSTVTTKEAELDNRLGVCLFRLPSEAQLNKGKPQNRLTATCSGATAPVSNGNRVAGEILKDVGHSLAGADSNSEFGQANLARDTGAVHLRRLEHRGLEINLRGRNNMTPSSLLLIHNNFIGHPSQHQLEPNQHTQSKLSTQNQHLSQLDGVNSNNSITLDNTNYLRQTSTELTSSRELRGQSTTCSTALTSSSTSSSSSSSCSLDESSKFDLNREQEQHPLPQHTSESTSDLPPRLMLASVSNHFKASETRPLCNLSSSTRPNNQSGPYFNTATSITSATNSSSSSLDPSRQDATTILTRTTEDNLQVSDILSFTSLDSTYFQQQSSSSQNQAIQGASQNSSDLASYALRSSGNVGSTGSSQFAAHYGVRPSRISQSVVGVATSPSNYSANFSTSMLEHQMKLEGEMLANGNRHHHHHHAFFNEPNSFMNSGSIEHHSASAVAVAAAAAASVASGNSNLDTRDATSPRKIQQQSRNHINQYYNSHYNLMPQGGTSKSSSPETSTTHSNNSTPSPKTKVMIPSLSQLHQQHSTTISNQLTTPSNSVSGSSSSISNQIQLDHLNNHYMSSNTSSTLGNHSQQNNSNNHNHPSEQHQQHHHQLQHQQHHQQGQNQHYGYSQSSLSGQSHEQAIYEPPNFNLQQQQQQLDQEHQQHLQQQQQLHQQQQQHQHQHQQQQQQQQQQHQQLQQQHHLHQQQLHQQQQQQAQAQNQHQHQHSHQSIYGNIYGSHAGSTNHYQNHFQTTSGHQANLVSGAHPVGTFNSAAAACAAAAVVSQTLKSVTGQQNQQNYHYGTSLSGSSFGVPNSGSIMAMTTHHQNQSFHPVGHLSTHQTSATLPQHQRQQSNIQMHHTTGIAVRKYQCKMCPQVFMSKAEMKYHNQNHMREAKPYKCLQCPKAFANSSYLSQHMRIHQGVKPYGCDICARKFTQLSHLQQHKRTHTGDKPYKCNYMNCTKQFSQLSNLQSHSRCHQLDKPYKCNSCYKCFHDEQSLLEHIPRHLESKHLKKNLCIFCGSSYQQERGLVKHFQQYHTDKSPTLVAAAIAAGTTGNTQLIASLISTTAPTNNNSFTNPQNNGAGGTISSSSSTSTSSSCSTSSNLSTGSLNVIQQHSHQLGSINNNNSHNIVNHTQTVSSGPTSGNKFD